MGIGRIHVKAKGYQGFPQSLLGVDAAILIILRDFTFFHISGLRLPFCCFGLCNDLMFP